MGKQTHNEEHSGREDMQHVLLKNYHERQREKGREIYPN